VASVSCGRIPSGTSVNQDFAERRRDFGLIEELGWRKANNDPKRQSETLPQSSSFVAHGSLAYSILACLRIGMSASASFQRVRKSW